MASVNFADVITFTRASGGGRFNASGVYEYVGNNVPRLDYDPVTLAPRGLLIEEQRTNTLLHSDNPGMAPWYYSNISVGPEITGLAYGVPWRELTKTTAVSSQHVSQVPLLSTVGATYVFSCALLAGTSASVNLGIGTQADTTGGIWGADAATSVVKISGPGVVARHSAGQGSMALVTDLSPTVPTRLFVTRTYQSAVNAGVYIYPGGFKSTNLADSVKVAMLQFELGAFPTSYIPTTTAQVTRAADVPNVNVLSPWYRADEGSIVVEMTPSTRVPADRIVLSLQRTSFVNDSIHLRTYNGQLIGAGYFGPTHEAALSYGEVSMGVTTKAGLAYALNDFRGIYTGGTVAVDTSARVPSVNKLCIGQSGAGANSWNGHICSIKYYPRRLSTAELQALTA